MTNTAAGCRRERDGHTDTQHEGRQDASRRSEGLHGIDSHRAPRRHEGRGDGDADQHQGHGGEGHGSALPTPNNWLAISGASADVPARPRPTPRAARAGA